jgi:hypothetical protein
LAAVGIQRMSFRQRNRGGRRGLVGFTDESAAAAGSELVADTVVERERSEQPRDVGEPLLWRHVPDHFAWKGELVVAVVFESGAKVVLPPEESSKVASSASRRQISRPRITLSMSPYAGISRSASASACCVGLNGSFRVCVRLGLLSRSDRLGEDTLNDEAPAVIT